MRSKIFSSDHMRASSKGQMWIPVFLSLGFLLAFPVAELLKLGNWFGMNYEPAQIEMLYENLWRDGLMATGFTVIFLAAVINGINGFWYLYSRKKVDFYHGLPITRKKLFWYKTGMGILYYLIPYMVCMFMALCIGAMRGFYSLKLLGNGREHACRTFFNVSFGVFCYRAGGLRDGKYPYGSLSAGRDFALWTASGIFAYYVHGKLFHHRLFL